jgi:[CysO sulfur-carrier protein]-S-L-cysteine hydrolase
VVIRADQIDEMVEHARQELPNEACGLLASREGIVQKVYRTRNVEGSPVRYNMDPQEQLRAMLDMDDRGWDLGGIFHSHPSTRAYPSQTDLGLAFYPDALYIIISLADHYKPDVRSYRIVDGRISEEPLEIVPALKS